MFDFKSVYWKKYLIIFRMYSYVAEITVLKTVKLMEFQYKIIIIMYKDY